MLFKMKEKVGPHFYKGKSYGPGETIECEKHELGGALDKFEQLSPDPPPPPEKELYVEVTSAGRFRVFNSETGIAIHDAKSIFRKDIIEMDLVPEELIDAAEAKWKADKEGAEDEAPEE